MRKTITTPALFFILITAFHLINTLIWTQLDGNSFLGCETIFHLERIYDIYRSMNPPGASYGESLRQVVTTPWLPIIRSTCLYPLISFYAFCMAVTGIIFNLPFSAIILFNTAFLSGLAVLTYRLGRLAHSKAAGLVAGGLVSFYPFAFGLSRKMTPELAVAMCVAAGWYCLLKSKGFSSRTYALLFGLSVLCGILINFWCVVYILPALVYGIWRMVKNRGRPQGIPVVFFLLSMIIIGSGSFLLFENLPHMQVVISEAFKELAVTLTTRSENFIGNADLATNELFLLAKPEDFCACTQFTDRGMNLRCFLFYAAQIPFVLSPFLTLLLIAGIIGCLFDRSSRHKLLFALWCVFPYFILCLWPKKWSRFLAPMFAPLALLTAIGLIRLVPARWQKPLTVGMIVITLGQFFFYSYAHEPSLPPMAAIMESLNAHRPMPTNFNDTAEHMMRTIRAQDTYDHGQTIAVLDILQTSGRFSQAWYNDLTNYLRLLLNLHSRTEKPVDLHWGVPANIDTYGFLLILTESTAALPETITRQYTRIEQSLLLPAEVSLSLYRRNF